MSWLCLQQLYWPVWSALARVVVSSFVLISPRAIPHRYHFCCIRWRHWVSEGIHLNRVNVQGGYLNTLLNKIASCINLPYVAIVMLETVGAGDCLGFGFGRNRRYSDWLQEFFSNGILIVEGCPGQVSPEGGHNLQELNMVWRQLEPEAAVEWR